MSRTFTRAGVAVAYRRRHPPPVLHPVRAPPAPPGTASAFRKPSCNPRTI